MRGNRYPVSEIGFKNLVRRLLEVGEEEIARDARLAEPCRVDFIPNARVNGRRCTSVQIDGSYRSVRSLTGLVSMSIRIAEA